MCESMAAPTSSGVREGNHIRPPPLPLPACLKGVYARLRRAMERSEFARSSRKFRVRGPLRSLSLGGESELGERPPSPRPSPRLRLSYSHILPSLARLVPVVGGFTDDSREYPMERIEFGLGGGLATAA